MLKLVTLSNYQIWHGIYMQACLVRVVKTHSVYLRLQFSWALATVKGGWDRGLAVGLVISQTVMLQQKQCLTSLIRLGEGFSSMFVFDHSKTLQGRVLFDIHYIMFKCWTLLLRLFMLSYWLKVMVGGGKRFTWSSFLKRERKLGSSFSYFGLTQQFRRCQRETLCCGCCWDCLFPEHSDQKIMNTNWRLLTCWWYSMWETKEDLRL